MNYLNSRSQFLFIPITQKISVLLQANTANRTYKTKRLNLDKKRKHELKKNIKINNKT